LDAGELSVTPYAASYRWLSFGHSIPHSEMMVSKHLQAKLDVKSR